MTRVRALADGDVKAIVWIFGLDCYAREPGVVLTSIVQRTGDPRPASKH